MTQHFLQLLVLFSTVTSVLLSQPKEQSKLNPLQIIHEWTFANFDYKTPEDRLHAESLGFLVPGNVAILDADFYIDPITLKRRIFVTCPQFLPGIPATFSEVRDRKHDNPRMSPYPSWDSQNINTCKGPISVFRIFIDKCGLLWVLDSGMVQTFINPKQACRPKVLIYDLKKNDELIERYEFPDGVISSRSILITIITESNRNDCRDSIAYIADVQARGLVVFDFPNKRSWRVENSYFYPFPDRAMISINNTMFQLMDGLFGLALSPPHDNPKKLYFHSAASIRESFVPTSVLKNETLAHDTGTLRREFQHSEDIREGQSTVEVMTDDGILIYPVLSHDALACWNSAQPLKKEFQHIFFTDHENFQFISGLKIKNKTLMISSSKLQNYILSKANGTDVKYRVMIIDNIDELLNGTPCKNYGIDNRNLGHTGGEHPQVHTTTHRPLAADETSNKNPPYWSTPHSQPGYKPPSVFLQPPHKPSAHEEMHSKGHTHKQSFHGSSTKKPSHEQMTSEETGQKSHSSEDNPHSKRPLTDQTIHRPTELFEQNPQHPQKHSFSEYGPHRPHHGTPEFHKHGLDKEWPDYQPAREFEDESTNTKPYRGSLSGESPVPFYKPSTGRKPILP